MADLDVALRLRLVNQLSGPAKVAEKDLAGLRGAAKGLDGAKGGERLARDLKRTGEAAGRAKKDIRELAGETGRIGRGEVGRNVVRGLDQIRRKAEETIGVLAKLRTHVAGNLQGIAGGSRADRGGLSAMLPGGFLPTIGTAAVIGAGAKTFGASISIEKSLAEVRKFYDLSDSELTKMKAEIFDMVGELGKAPEAIASVYARAGQQGVPRDQVREYARDVAKIAVAWDMGEEAAANGLGTIKSSLGLTQPELVKIAGTINTLADGMEGPVAESDLLEYLSRVAGTAKALGGSAKAALAMGAALRSAGDQPEIAATTFNTILTKLASADRGSKDAIAGYKELGFDPNKLSKDMQANADVAMRAFFDKIRELRAKGKNVIGPIADIFGTEYSDNILKFVNVMDTYDKALKMVADDAAGVGTLDRSYKIQSSTTDAQLARFRANMKMTADAMAADYLPGVNSGLERMNALLKEIRGQGSAFNDLAAGAQGFAKGLGYDDVGKMLDDLSTKLHELSGPGTTAEFRYATMFESSRKAAEAFRQELEYIGDLYNSVFGDAGEKAASKERLNRKFDDATAEMSEKANGRFDPELAARRWAIGEDRFNAAMKRRADARAAVAPKAAPNADRAAAIDALRSGLTGRAALPAANLGAKPVVDRTAMARIEGAFSAAGAGPKPKIELEPKVDLTAMQRIEQMLSLPLDGAATKAMAGFDGALEAQGQKAIGTAQQIAAQLQSILSFHAAPTISPRFTSPSAAGATPAAPAGGATGKQSSLSRGGDTKVAINQTFSHASPRAAARAAQSAQNRAVREAKARSLHDLGSPWA